LPFALGWNDDELRYEAAKKGWLTQYPDFNSPYIETFSEDISYQGTIKPLKTLTITFKGQKGYMENLKEQFNAVGDTYHPLVPTTMGNFSISTMLINTAFENVSDKNSPAFDRMLNNRLSIARRLAAQRGVNVPVSGYPDGYGPLQNEVVMYSFLTGYANTNPEKVSLSPFKNIPIPNWRVKFSGLTKYEWIKKIFKNLSLEHNYRSDYTINQFTNNLQTFQDPNARDASGNYYSDLVMDNITLTEAFNPLIKVNMELHNSLKLDFAFKQDRTISLNLNNYTLSEMFGKEYSASLGYRLKDITLPLKLAGRRIEFTSDLILKVNGSMRHSITVLRSLSDDNNQITAGQTMYNLKFTADYALTRYLSAILFYNHSYSEYAISTSYPFTNIRGGLTIKYTFGN
jgi:cell surface protein SprA